ncbi:hypothetical protein [Streptomyces sp. NPDC056682]|uniref:hypothetical protein n=1 Tax=Streptomyces sp. NPDC056682 TaxID=3345909 RepID=UPI0036CB2771
MATATEPLPVSDDRWHALGYELPEACPVHHCWTNECPAGSHDEGDGEWDDNEPLPPGYPDWHCILCGDSGLNGDPHHCDGRGEGS